MNPKISYSTFMLSPISGQKRGEELGSFLVNFVATIVLVILLISFAVASSWIKSSAKADAGLVVQKGDKIGNSDGVGYMNNYAKLVEVRMKISDGVSLDNAIAEAGYEK